MSSKLILPKQCPSDDYLLVAVSSKYSNKKILVTSCDQNNLSLVTDQNLTLTQPIAIANFLLEDSTLLANQKIDGPEFETVRNNINEYVAVAGNLISPNAALKTHPLFNARAVEKDAELLKNSEKVLSGILKDLNQHLQLNTFLAAERITLADLAVASSLVLLYRSGLQRYDSENSRFLNRWFRTVANQQQFIASQGENISYFPENVLKFDGKKFAEIQKEIKGGAGLKTTPAKKAASAPKKPDGKGDGKKEKAASAAVSSPAAAENEADMDPKKLAKKKAKEAAKAAKEAKFKAKQAAAAAQKQTKNEKPKEKKPAAKKDAGPEIVHYTVQQQPGEKKSITCELPKNYSPRYVEAQWYSWWEKSGFFKPEYGRKSVSEINDKGTFMICIPPPNVTGALHLGHALTNSIEDTLTRWHRMNGKTTLWNPGCDHAGIATQVIVEKRLQKEMGKSRHDLGREKFLEKVWEWKNEKGNTIYDQIKSLGASCDWDRAAFTMDPKLQNAVAEAFCRMHDKGVIFRANRLVNWSSKLNSAISNLEVDKKEIKGRTLVSVPGYDEKVEVGVLIFFSYKIEGEPNAEITVATTRIETMLGDVAIAVHPSDERYKSYIGKTAIHPFIPGRKIQILADDYVDKNFGTGAVKITPAHDPNDFEIGKRHNLEFITIFTDDGNVCNTGTKYDGMKRFDVRRQIVEDLKAVGSYQETKDNDMVVPFCSRSKDIVEPLIKAQWFVNTENMCKRSCDAVRSGDLKIIPKMFEKTWFSWLENPQDWCISRQLWWGHRIPAYFVEIEGESDQNDARSSDDKYWISGRSLESVQAKAQAAFPGKKFTLKQDEDVLDTWFSSALFPFSIFGWPEQTEDLATFFPGSLLETGHDILFFWVARMVMFSLELTDKIPFKEVYLHAMVRDAHGKKMSKSVGNVIDPVWVIEGRDLPFMQEQLKSGNIDYKDLEKALEGQRLDYPDGIPECGADAMRFALCAYTAQGKNINLDVMRVVGYRRFCNKLWNATKFAMNCLGDFDSRSNSKYYQNLLNSSSAEYTNMNSMNKWILSKMAKAIQDCNSGMADYDFPKVTTSIYSFWLYELCDVYLEAIKPIVYNTGNQYSEQEINNTKFVLNVCLDVGLRLLAPIMPYITEELWQRIPRFENDRDSIHIMSYPSSENVDVANLLDYNGIDASFEFSYNAVSAIRSLRSDYNLTPKQQTEIYVKSPGAQIQQMENFKLMMQSLANGSDLKFVQADQNENFPKGCGIAVVNDQCEIGLMLKGIINVAKELEKLNKELSKVENSIKGLEGKMAKETYAKVPEKVKEKDVAKLESSRNEASKLREAIANFQEMA